MTQSNDRWIGSSSVPALTLYLDNSVIGGCARIPKRFGKSHPAALGFCQIRAVAQTRGLGCDPAGRFSRPARCCPTLRQNLTRQIRYAALDRPCRRTGTSLCPSRSAYLAKPLMTPVIAIATTTWNVAHHCQLGTQASGQLPARIGFQSHESHVWLSQRADHQSARAYLWRRRPKHLMPWLNPASGRKLYGA